MHILCSLPAVWLSTSIQGSLFSSCKFCFNYRIVVQNSEFCKHHLCLYFILQRTSVVALFHLLVLLSKIFLETFEIHRGMLQTEQGDYLFGVYLRAGGERLFQFILVYAFSGDQSWHNQTAKCLSLHFCECFKT